MKIKHDDGPVDVKIIDETETTLGINFPIAYKELISKHNTARLIDCYFTTEETDLKKRKRSLSFFGFGEEVCESEQINIMQPPSEIAPSGVIAFGASGNGDYICFNYRTESVEPSISLLIHDELDANGNCIEIHLADTFTNFTKMLFE